MDQNSLFTDPNSPITDAPTALFNRSNALLSNLQSEYGKDYYGVTLGKGMDEAATGRANQLGGIRSSLAARGLAGSGAEAAAARGAQTLYNSALLRNIQNAGSAEDRRKQALLNQMSDVYGKDVSLLGSLAGGQLAGQKQAVDRTLQQYKQQLGWTDTVAGLIQIAAAAAGGYYGGAASGASGAIAGASAGKNLAQGQQAPNDYGYNNVDMYGRQVSPPVNGRYTYGPSDSMAGPGLQVSVPAEADASYREALRASGALGY